MKQESLEIETATPAPRVLQEARPADFPRPFAMRLIWPALGVMLFALMMLAFTKQTYFPLYRLTRSLPSEYLVTAKQFVSPFMILLLIAVIWIFDPRRRATVMVLLVAVGVGGLVNEPIKQLTGRARPTYSLRLTDENREWIAEYLQKKPHAPIQAKKQDQWLGLKPGRPLFKDGYSSFPSGHANSAFILFAFLLALYPRGRWVWLAGAVGCALARVAFRRHFPEDVLFGGALGWITAQWVFSWHWPYRLGCWLCTRLSRKAAPAPAFTTRTAPQRITPAAESTITANK